VPLSPHRVSVCRSDSETAVAGVYRIWDARRMDAWLAQWFSANQTDNGGVIRRKRQDVDKYSSLAAVIAEAKNRGWHVVETGGQVVVLCHTGALNLHT